MLKHIAVICLCMGMIVSCQAQEPVKKPDIPKLQSSDAGFPPDAAMRYDERSGCIFRLEGKNLSENLENDKSFQGLTNHFRACSLKTDLPTLPSRLLPHIIRRSGFCVRLKN